MMVMIEGIHSLGLHVAKFIGWWTNRGQKPCTELECDEFILSALRGNSERESGCNAWLVVQYAGLVISPIAVLFMLYALYMYQKRTMQILNQRRAVRYDDQRGPIFLVILLGAALIIAMVFTANAAFG